MAEKTETIFVIWDFEDREARFRLLELEKHIDAGLRGAGLRIVAPRPIRWDRVLDRICCLAFRRPTACSWYCPDLLNMNSIPSCFRSDLP